MAIRRPSIDSPTWLFQDFLYLEAQGLGGPELRYLQVKWDGEPYTRVSQSFDYSDPPFVGLEQRGGCIVAQVDYEIDASTKLVTIYGWETNWRDEWPLRLAVNYLTQCLYHGPKGYVIRVAGDQVYSQAGNIIDVAGKDPYAFWVSEQFFPLTNQPGGYLVLAPSGGVPVPSAFSSSYSVSISPNPAGPGDVLYVIVDTSGVNLGTTLYWKITGPGVTPSFFQTGVMSGSLSVGS